MNVVCIHQVSGDFSEYNVLNFISMETGDVVEKVIIHANYYTGWGIKTIKLNNPNAKWHERYEKYFNVKEDVFKQKMQEAGFNMKGWCVYKRIKVKEEGFWQSIVQNYKGMNVLNVIELEVEY